MASLRSWANLGHYIIRNKKLKKRHQWSSLFLEANLNIGQILIRFIYLCICMGTCVPQRACEGQRRNCHSGFSPSTMRVPRIELRSSRALLDKHLQQWTHLIGPPSVVQAEVSLTCRIGRKKVESIYKIQVMRKSPSVCLLHAAYAPEGSAMNQPSPPSRHLLEFLPHLWENMFFDVRSGFLLLYLLQIAWP